MQTIKNVIQLHNLSTHSGIAARVEPNSLVQTTTSSTSADSERQKSRIDSLFLRLAAMYGHIWRSLYKSDAFLAFTKSEWLDGLIRFEDKVIEKTLMTCLNNWELPPTLPQFVESCRAHSKLGLDAKSSRISKPSSPDVAYAHLSQIKAILNMNPTSARVKRGNSAPH